MTADRLAVVIETTAKKSFASAVDWPGWARSGTSSALALEALLAYAVRYEAIAAAAGVAVPGALEPEVIETLAGDATTAFGAPSMTFQADRAPTNAADAARLADLVVAAWRRFDAVARAAPPELRKGPRGGGRDTAKIVDHVVGAEQAYARRIGLRPAPVDPFDRAAVAAYRSAIRDVLARPSDGSPLASWTQRYAARRIAWHVLDHAWEIEDRRPA